MDCQACGFVWEAWSTEVLPDELRALGPQWREAVEAASEHPRLRLRPQPEVWSPLEYACHVRDVLLMQRGRLYLALAGG